MNLAFVIRHYGIEKTSGLEIYCRTIAEILYKRGLDITIYTFPDGKKEGEYILNGVLIKRFHRFIENILRDEKEFDAIIFFGTEIDGTYKLAETLKKKKILVPYLYGYSGDNELLLNLLSKFDALLFITEREKLKLKLEFKKQEFIDFAMEKKRKIESQEFRKKYFVLSDYILSFCDEEDLQETIANFRILRREFPFLSLIISGKFSKISPFDPDLKYIELKDEKERLEGIKGSIFTLFPSQKDSPNYHFLESLSVGIPAVVNEKNGTLVDYCLKSNGGLWYSGTEEFIEVASLIVKDKLIRNEMGSKAQKYIEENHSPEKIFHRWKDFLNSII